MYPLWGDQKLPSLHQNLDFIIKVYHRTNRLEYSTSAVCVLLLEISLSKDIFVFSVIENTKKENLQHFLLEGSDLSWSLSMLKTFEFIKAF